MAKKRKGGAKKHRFSPDHVQTVNPATATAAKSVPAPRAVGSIQAAAEMANVAAADLVRREVARVLLLAAGFVALLIILWLLFTHTGLGHTVYGWVKL